MSKRHINNIKLKLSGLVKGDVELTKRSRRHTSTATTTISTTTQAKGINETLSGNLEGVGN